MIYLLFLIISEAYEVLYFEEALDHFNPSSGKLKIKTLFTQGSLDGPLFVYTGNEAAIEAFYENSGWLTGELQKEFNASLAFIEHRYYGSSTVSPFTWKYLSMEQVMYDFADIIRQLKPKSTTKVITFGGSYGGMLAAFMRMKYPHIVAGAIASSAPILMQLDNGTSYFNLVTHSLKASSVNCATRVAQGNMILEEMIKRTEYWNTLDLIFQPCKPFDDELISHLINWISYAFGTMAVYNYPYPSDLLSPLPAHPINATCSFFKDTSTYIEVLVAFKRTIELFYGKEECYDFTVDRIVINVDPFQYCTELIIPIGSYGPPSDSFRSSPWNFNELKEECRRQFGDVSFGNDWVEVSYGIVSDMRRSLQYASNIVFSTGSLDPWSFGCLKEKDVTNSKLKVIEIEGAAHHMELRTPADEDPVDVVKARATEKSLIDTWINNS